MGYYSNGAGSEIPNMNYPDGMTKADWVAVGEIEPEYEPETSVLRAVVYITYHGEPIEPVQSPSQAERNIERALRRGLKEVWNEIEVVDAKYLTEDEANG